MTIAATSAPENDLSALRPKLVIWDLDGTLWRGVIDGNREGELRTGVSLIPHLSSRGVVNTICSNNTPTRALEKLEEWGVLAHTVFEQISWHDKVLMLSRILDFFAFSPADVIFVDDDARVRTRAGTELGIITVSPDELDGANLSLWGSSTTSSRRLDHYRVIALRRQAEIEYSSMPALTKPADFLRTCEILVDAVDVDENAERIAELSHRSNHLNITHSRLDVLAVRALAADADYQCAALEVRDRFGDYGLCGFLAFDKARRRLAHFFWSCRILNQGIVEFVAGELHKHHGITVDAPRLIDFDAPIDWVCGDPLLPPPCATTAPLPSTSTDSVGRRVLLIGGCDLDIVAALWHTPDTAVEVRGLREHNNIQQYAHSSTSLLAARYRGQLDSARVSCLPWIGQVEDPHTWSQYTTVVLSLWVDYSCLTIRHREDPIGVIAPEFIQLNGSSTDWDWDHWIGDSLSRLDYAAEFVHGPPLTAEELADRVRTLSTMVPKGVQLVLLGAPEIERGQQYSWGELQLTRNRALNAAIAELSAVLDAVTFVDLNRFVRTSNDLADPDEPTGFHYRRDVYARLARELRNVVS